MLERTANLEAVIAREQIRDCLSFYCRGVDRRDPDLIRAAYWPGAVDDHIMFIGDVEQFIAWSTVQLDAMDLTQHMLGHSYIQVNGARAIAETYFLAYHRVPVDGELCDIVMGGRYLDRFERRGDEWRIAGRTVVSDWTRDFGPSYDQSKGVFGQLPLGEHSLGKAKGDVSETFFTWLDEGA